MMHFSYEKLLLRKYRTIHKFQVCPHYIKLLCSQGVRIS